MNVYIVIAIIFILATLLGWPLARRMVVNSVENSLLRQDYAAFDRKIDKGYVKLFIPPFNVDYLKLNRAIMEGNREDIDQRFEHFDHVNLTEVQKENVYLRGFEYYLSVEDRPLTDKYYRLIKELKNPDMITYVDHLYDIYVLKGWTYLDEMLVQAETLPEGQLMEIYSMIAAMYHNKGDEEKAKEYLEKIDSELKK